MCLFYSINSIMFKDNITCTICTLFILITFFILCQGMKGQSMNITVYSDKRCVTQCPQGVNSYTKKCQFSCIVSTNTMDLENMYFTFLVKRNVHHQFEPLFPLQLPNECDEYKNKSDLICSTLDYGGFNVSVLVTPTEYEGGQIKCKLLYKEKSFYSDTHNITFSKDTIEATGNLTVNNHKVSLNNCSTSVNREQLHMHYTCMDNSLPCFIAIYMNDSRTVINGINSTEFSFTFKNNKILHFHLRTSSCSSIENVKSYDCIIFLEGTENEHNHGIIIIVVTVVLSLGLLFVTLVTIMVCKKKLWKNKNESSNLSVTYTDQHQINEPLLNSTILGPGSDVNNDVSTSNDEVSIIWSPYQHNVFLVENNTLEYQENGTGQSVPNSEGEVNRSTSQHTILSKAIVHGENHGEISAGSITCIQCNTVEPNQDIEDANQSTNDTKILAPEIQNKDIITHNTAISNEHRECLNKLAGEFCDKYTLCQIMEGQLTIDPHKKEIMHIGASFYELIRHIQVNQSIIPKENYRSVIADMKLSDEKHWIELINLANNYMGPYLASNEVQNDLNAAAFIFQSARLFEDDVKQWYSQFNNSIFEICKSGKISEIIKIRPDCGNIEDKTDTFCNGYTLQKQRPLLKIQCNNQQDHTKFISTNDFTLEHLPEKWRNNDMFKVIKLSAALTVKIILLSACNTNINDVRNFSISGDFKEDILVPSGTGWIVDVLKDPDCENDTCNCQDCKLTSSPKKVEGTILICTSKSTTFKNGLVENSVCVLDYDSENSEKSTFSVSVKNCVKTFGECCLIPYRTCNLESLNRLESQISEYNDMYSKVYAAFKNSWEEYRISIIVSHPHGGPKQISIGNWTDRKEESKNKYSYYYDTCACEGSTGANVFIPGSTPSIYFNQIVHLGRDIKTKLNFSSESTGIRDFRN